LIILLQPASQQVSITGGTGKINTTLIIDQKYVADVIAKNITAGLCLTTPDEQEAYIHVVLTHLTTIVTHLATEVTHLATVVTHLATVVTHLAMVVTHFVLRLKYQSLHPITFNHLLAHF